MLELAHITKTYRQRRQTITALDDVSLAIPDGSVFGVAGRSGAGKSTLIRVINALERPDSGQVLLDGVDVLGLPLHELRRRRRRIGMIFQHFNLLHSRTARENIEFPLRIAGVEREERRNRANELIDLVGLGDRADNYPSQLSGGQKQRVGIARALAARPSILLSDEATSALDPDTTAQIIELLLDINRELGLTIVLITHELGLLRRHATEVAGFEQGRKTDQGRVIDLIRRPESPLGAELLPAFTDTPLPAGTVRTLVTTGPQQSGRDILPYLALRVGHTFHVLSGGLYNVSGDTVARFEIALPDTPQDRAGLQAAIEHSDIEVRYAHE